MADKVYRVLFPVATELRTQPHGRSGSQPARQCGKSKAAGSAALRHSKRSSPRPRSCWSRRVRHERHGASTFPISRYTVAEQLTCSSP